MVRTYRHMLEGMSYGMTGHRDQWFGGRTYAQHGDDLAVLNIFKRLGIERPSYLDVGAYHPFDLSNTALLYERGSRGINVEPNEALFGAVSSRRGRMTSTCASAWRRWPGRCCSTMSPPILAASPSTATAVTLGIVRSVEVPVVTLNMIVDFMRRRLAGSAVDRHRRPRCRRAALGRLRRPSAARRHRRGRQCGSGDTSHELAALMAAKGFVLHSWAATT
jgi:hypothetical protein